ncbi:MAG: Y-family DNA polymerase [Pseudomonadales bacterium]
MYALCDATSMYASCEKVFDPAIRNKPVVVLSNNDGCIVAACPIAKRAGVGKKFIPYFQVREALEQAGAVIRSSNYELYADLSQRMMDRCATFAPNCHVYSIDECFLSFDHWQPDEGWLEYARRIRRTIWKEVRLPIGVGVGSTPTLAKVANHAAKKLPGFRGAAVIDSEAQRRNILQQLQLEDVWGIGRRLAPRLRDLGIHNAWQLACAKPGWIRKQFSITLENTVYELNGQCKISWDEVRAPKKEIFSTRSFGQRVSDKDQLHQALSSHVSIAASKLRKQQSLASAMLVFASNSPHDNTPFYRGAHLHRFITPTQDTLRIANACRTVLERIYRPGIQFYRCGIGLMDICPQHHYQQDLFRTQCDNTALMQCLDSIHQRFGRDSLFIAGQGTQQKFAMRREFQSPRYTTRVKDFPVVQC